MATVSRPILVRVKLEPVLEAMIYGMNVEQVERLARIHYRWAKQLCRKAEALREAEGQPPRFPFSQLSRYPSGYRGRGLVDGDARRRVSRG